MKIHQLAARIEVHTLEIPEVALCHYCGLTRCILWNLIDPKTDIVSRCCKFCSRSITDVPSKFPGAFYLPESQYIPLHCR